MLQNTADVRMRAWGKTLQELFCHALRGMASFLKPDILLSKKKDLKERHEIRVEAVDITGLLIEFLSQALAQSDIKGAVFADVSFKEFGENFLSGKLIGVKTADGTEKEIKAISYQEADIRKNPETGMYETILVFDI